MTLSVSPSATVAVPVMTGVVSEVVWATTVGTTAGAVVSMVNSPALMSVLVLPTGSLATAVTL